MKIWQKYNKYLTTGEWHVHTNYTDGGNSVHEYCEKAVKMEIPLLAFTEHVRQKLTYDFSNFLNDIEKARDEFDLIILSGCEAKVLVDGELDVETDILKELDYPIFAYHSFPNNNELYIDCLKKVITNKYVNAWAHPGYFLTKSNMSIPYDILVDIFRLMAKENVLLEINSKYMLPQQSWIELAQKYSVNFVNGSDTHCIKEVENRRVRDH